MATAETKSHKNIEQLNSFLRGEISAVETYRLALDKVSYDSPVRAQLEANRNSHERRVQALEHKIRSLGGLPAKGSGPWGALVKAVETVSKALGRKATISALEQGEDHGLKDYRTDLKKLDPDGQLLVTSELLPQQEETHRAMRELQGDMRKGSPA